MKKVDGVVKTAASFVIYLTFFGAFAGYTRAEILQFSKDLDPRYNDCDFDDNGIVDYNDLKEITYDWLSEDPNHIQNYTDLDDNGIVNFNDFTIFSKNWQWKTPNPKDPVLTLYEVITYDTDPNGLIGEFLKGTYLFTNVTEDSLECDEVTIPMGTNQGVDPTSQYNHIPDGWYADFYADKTVFYTTNPGSTIKPCGGPKQFSLFSNNSDYAMKQTAAKTKFDEDFITPKADVSK